MERKLNMAITMIKILCAVFSIIDGGLLQSAILRPDMHYVYIGMSVSVWVACSIIIYNAAMRITLLILGIYEL